jgi:predicted nuclease of restriction endonuclease-like (RecB) superfamily
MTRISSPAAPFPAAEYALWLREVKDRIRNTRTTAALAVNAEVLRLNWSIGREILDRQDVQGWGAKVVDRLSNDLLEEFPGMRGFSRSNLRSMRAFAAAWPDPAIFQQAVGRLPWGHQVKLIEKLDNSEQRRWYAQAAVEYGWSRDVLVHQIDTRLMERQGAAITNFSATLPTSQSELAQQLTRDPYVFDALGLTPRLKERELEDALVSQMEKFLLELGRGFAFMGRQFPLEVGGQQYFLDLLFYNTRLHAHVVIELKTDDFKPEYAGKMQFYLTSVDELLRSEGDNPSIGLILCKTRNGVIAEYTLRDATKPMGVAEYRLSLPAALANELPTTDRIRRAFEMPSDDEV